MRANTARSAIAAAALLAAALSCLLLLGGGVAGAHPGPVDGTGGHLCTQQQNTADLCTPAGSYHRHTPDGNMVLATAPAGASATLAQTTPTTTAPGTPTTAVTVVGAPSTPPTPPPMARTGAASKTLALLGALITALGLAAAAGVRLTPLPVVLELTRPTTPPRR